MRVARSVRALASPAARIPVGRQACRGCVWHRFVQCVFYCVYVNMLVPFRTTSSARHTLARRHSHPRNEDHELCLSESYNSTFDLSRSSTVTA